MTRQFQGGVARFCSGPAVLACHFETSMSGRSRADTRFPTKGLSDRSVATGLHSQQPPGAKPPLPETSRLWLAQPAKEKEQKGLKCLSVIPQRLEAGCYSNFCRCINNIMASRILRVKGTACDVVVFFFFQEMKRQQSRLLPFLVVEEGACRSCSRAPRLYPSHRNLTAASAPVMWSEKVCGVG